MVPPLGVRIAAQNSLRDSTSMRGGRLVEDDQVVGRRPSRARTGPAGPGRRRACRPCGRRSGDPGGVQDLVERERLGVGAADELDQLPHRHPRNQPPLLEHGADPAGADGLFRRARRRPRPSRGPAGCSPSSRRSWSTSRRRWGRAGRRSRPGRWTGSTVDGADRAVALGHISQYQHVLDARSAPPAGQSEKYAVRRDICP